MKRYKTNTRRVVNRATFEDFLERFEESERRTKADTQKEQSYIEIEKNKAQEMGKKKQKKDLERQENVSSKMKLTLEIKASRRCSSEVVAGVPLIILNKLLGLFRTF